MKKTILICFLTVLGSATLNAEVNVNKCDTIQKKGPKIDCLADLKKQLIKNKAKGQLKVVTSKLDELSSKKKEFDNENKTLWGMWKNRNK